MSAYLGRPELSTSGPGEHSKKWDDGGGRRKIED